MKIQLYQPLAIRKLGKRANQEDNIYPAMGQATEQDQLFVLCDGMGGHEHGEVASQSVCKSISEYLSQQSSISADVEDDVLKNALAYAYQELDKLAVADDTRQMGTTLTLLYFHQQGCTVAHIGDSRIYHLRPVANTILYKSRDHSLAYDLYQAGELSYEEMKTFPQKNIITRAMIAGDKSHPKADVVHITDIQSGDYFYICSDGMLEQMEDKELLEIFSSDKSDEEKRVMLINATVENRDNHSAYIVHIRQVFREEADVTLVNEEPTAKCNAINIKPDVEEVAPLCDVQVVSGPSKEKPSLGTPPPMPEYVVEMKRQKQKIKLFWLIGFVVFVVILFGGIVGYGYFSKPKAKKERLDSLNKDSVSKIKAGISSKIPKQAAANLKKKDTTNKDSASLKQDKNKK